MRSERMALTIEEAAEYTGIGQNTLRQLIKWETMPVLKVGRKTLIKTDTLSEFLSVNQDADLRNREAVRSLSGPVN